MAKRATTEEFIAKARKIHGDRYDYSKVNYVNSKTKVNIVCSIHGNFEQIPNVHLMKCGCPECGREISNRKRSITTEIFIEKSRLVHGNKYDYSQVEYINNRKKVKIICPTHGLFLQVPDSHMCGKGCIYCGGRAPLTKETFIFRSQEKHGQKYDYSRVEYINNIEKVEIVCKKHGSFYQSPSHHMDGEGCPECALLRISSIYRLPKDKFVERSKIKHEDKYDYSLVEYKNLHDKVKIICPQHGIFLQEPNSHLSGRGCPRCAYSNCSKEEKEWLQSLNISSMKYSFIIRIDGKKFIVDGFDPDTNTIYEYLGGFWHGNPEVFDHNEVNPKNGKIFGLLYRETMDRIDKLRQAGYSVVYKWG